MKHKMTLRDIARLLDAEVLTGEDKLDTETVTACGSDLMSDVLAFVKDKTILITGLVNAHVIRTAEMLDIICVVFARGKRPSEDILEQAREIDLPVLATKLTTYTACGELYLHGLPHFRRSIRNGGRGFRVHQAQAEAIGHRQRCSAPHFRRQLRG